MYDKIVLVTRKTRLEALVARFNTKAQARFYINQSAQHAASATDGDAFNFYQQEHDTYYAALERLTESLQALAKVHTIEREFLPNFLFSKSDLVVTIGIDGLVVNTAKYLDGQPIVAVNPDPAHIDGILLPFEVATAHRGVAAAMGGSAAITPITMAEARLNDGQSLLAFNDLFIGAKTHVSARYGIEVGGVRENHSSSGIIVSTGAGATGWLSSMFNMANGIASTFGGATPFEKPQLPWDTDHLLFAVREPFISKTSGAEIVCGAIGKDEPLILESHMPAGGVIFSDGVEADFVAFNSGAVATIQVAARTTNLVVAT